MKRIGSAKVFNLISGWADGVSGRGLNLFKQSADFVRFPEDGRRSKGQKRNRTGVTIKRKIEVLEIRRGERGIRGNTNESACLLLKITLVSLFCKRVTTYDLLLSHLLP